MAGGLTYLQQFYGPLLQYDGLKLNKKNTEHGMIRDKELVLIPIAPPKGKRSLRIPHLRWRLVPIINVNFGS